MSNSGTSTPRDTAVTPPPGGEGPSPLVVGTRFVKQYYNILTQNPENLHKIYQSTSVLSKGQGSQPTKPASFESQSDTVKDRFVLEGFEGCPVRFEFEHGAIDAQLSVNGGVLLVVTGHIVYMPKPDDDASTTSSTRKAFVHTFFLGATAHGAKRSYYVHNDVLRFLSEVETDQKASSAAAPSGTSESKPAVVEAPSSTVEPPAEKPVEAEKVPMNGGTETAKEEAPGGGVEESKDVTGAEKEEKVTVPTSSTPPPSSMDEAPGGGVEESKDETPARPSAEDAQAKPKPTPGSWASLVASGASVPGTASAPGTPSRPTATATSPKPKPTPTSSTTAPSKPKPSVEVSKPADGGPVRGGRNIKRDPDCTLVIKNLDVQTTEQDVIGVFEPFAVQCEGKIVGITVSAHKNIAFVDYDTSVPVLKAVEQHEKEPLQIHGRKLEMYQKSLEQGRGGRGRGGRGYRGGGGDYRGSGRGSYRRDRMSGRGDRGGPGSGRSGRGGQR